MPITDDPLPPGQVWCFSPGDQGEGTGLFRIDVTSGPGSGVRVLNLPTPPPLKESVRCAEQNLYTRAKELVGDRDPRSHEFSVQVRAFDANKTAAPTGVGVILALCSSLLEKRLKGGLVVVGGLNLGGSIEPICKLPQDQVRGIVETHNTPELWDNEKEQMDGSADRSDAARA